MTQDERTFERLSGRELAELRRKAGLTQAQLAQATGIGRHAVSYWEQKERVDENVQAPRHMLAVLGVRVVRAAFRDTIVRAGTPARNGVLVPEWEQRALDRLEAQHEARQAKRASREAARAAKSGVTEATPLGTKPSASPPVQREPCSALTRKGLPCRGRFEPGRRRCKFHGGMSTGPRTAEGRARIAEAQRRRWLTHRMLREVAVSSTRSDDGYLLLAGSKVGPVQEIAD